jgi:hypothetical protein
MNAKAHHVYARPASTSYVMIDDLDEDGLDALRAAGHRPAAVVVTSSANHQAWLRLPGDEGAVSSELSSAVARLAARRFEGDAGAASSVQVGRLPGFTNSKAIYADRYGRYPFALLRTAAGGVDWKGRELLQAAGAELAARDAGSAAVAVAGSDMLPRRRPSLRACTPEEGRQRIAGALSDARPDRSRLDHAIAARLLGRGATEAYVRAVLLAGERAREQGRGAEEYVARTIAAGQRAEVRHSVGVST